MIPQLNQSGVLPPFIREQGPTDPAGMAPYKTTITEFVLRYAHTPDRRSLLKGLLDYRRKLKSIGVRNGFQWLDGSFVENVELSRGRPPSDVDVVTFALRPTDDLEQWKKLVNGNTDLFLPNEAKQKYRCDAYFVDLNTHPIHVVSNTRYWFGLFSHQRDSFLWKGMLEIPIECSDNQALEVLDREAGNA